MPPSLLMYDHDFSEGISSTTSCRRHAGKGSADLVLLLKEPGLAEAAALVGLLHDLRKGGIVLARVLRHESVQAHALHRQCRHAGLRLRQLLPAVTVEAFQAYESTDKQQLFRLHDACTALALG